MARIKSITKKHVTTETLHNLAVEVDESFVANGIVVHNCKSWIEPVVMGKLGNREIQKLETKTTKKGLESIQFGEALAFALSEASKTGL